MTILKINDVDPEKLQNTTVKKPKRNRKVKFEDEIPNDTPDKVPNQKYDKHLQLAIKIHEAQTISHKQKFDDADDKINLKLDHLKLAQKCHLENIKQNNADKLTPKPKKASKLKIDLQKFSKKSPKPKKSV